MQGMPPSTSYEGRSEKKILIAPCFSNRADVYAVSSTSCDTHICGKPRLVTRRGLGIRRCTGFQALACSAGPSYQRYESVKYQFNTIDQTFTEPTSFQPCHLLLRYRERPSFGKGTTSRSKLLGRGVSRGEKAFVDGGVNRLI